MQHEYILWVMVVAYALHIVFGALIMAFPLALWRMKSALRPS